MVVVEFSVEEMKNIVNISKNEIIEGLNNLGAPSEFEEETNKIITELTPNRPDWYSMEGLARSLNAYYKNKTSNYEVNKSNYQVFVESIPERQYTSCAVVKNLEFSDARIKDMVLLQEKLLGTLGRKVKKFGIGIYPLNEIKFPIKYTKMKKEKIRYVPLGYEKEMGAEEVLNHHKKGQQYGHLIKNWKEYPVFIDDNKKIMSLVPIVNSKDTGKIDIKTQDIFIEVTGTDINSCNAALNILCCTFADMSGKIFEVEVIYKENKTITPNLMYKKIDLDESKVNRILGLKLDKKEIEYYLSKMDYKCKNGIYIQPYRADIINDVDIIEDIAIAYGYNNFTKTIPDFFTPGKIIDIHKNYEEAMKGMGFLEIKTFILTNKEKMSLTGHDKTIEITNPNNVEYTMIRPTLIPDILEIFSNNKMKGIPQKYFEIGIVNESEKRLVFGYMDKEIKFSDFRSYLQTLAKNIGFDFELQKADYLFLDEESSSNIIINNLDKGLLGKVRKNKLEKIGIEFDVFVCEIEL